MTRAGLREFAAILRPWRASLAVVVASVLAGAALELAPPLIVRELVDRHLATGDARGVFALAALYLGVLAAQQLVGLLTVVLTARSAEGALHRLRVDLFEHLTRLPIPWFDRNPIGDAIARVTADVAEIDALFSSGVVGVVADVVRAGGVLVTMIALSPALTGIALLAIGPVVLVSRAFQRRVADAQLGKRAAVGAWTTSLHETLANVEVVRAFGREAHATARGREATADALAADNAATVWSALYSPTMALVAAVGTTALLAAAAIAPSVGTLTAFALLFQRFFKPVTALGDEWQTVQAAIAGATRVFAVLGEPVEQRAARSEPTAGPALDVRDVDFGYGADPVLRRISLSVATGEVVAIVGRTGAGKSSLVQLLVGSYAPWTGSVRVAGVDPRSLEEADRARVVALVPQVAHVLDRSLLDNVTLGDARVDRATAARALAEVGLSELVARLGPDTPVRASDLSGGERQLVALARALARDPAVLLLDEATSAVDARAEAAVREVILRSATRRAVIVVAHRLSMARAADRVVVVDGGCIVEEGTPAELASGGGRYAALATLDTTGWGTP